MERWLVNVDNRMVKRLADHSEPAEPSLVTCRVHIATAGILTSADIDYLVNPTSLSLSTP